jgi:hypothetical protein
VGADTGAALYCSCIETGGCRGMFCIGLSFAGGIWGACTGSLCMLRMGCE